MYDSVTVSEIPHDAAAVAGYVNGHYQTFPTLQTNFPHAHLLSIAVTADADAECLDVERGDARPEQTPAWVKRQIARGVHRPVVYSAVSEMHLVLAALEQHGVKRSDVRVWTAHYTGKPHRCTVECGFDFAGTADATQYTDRALARNLDASLCAANFFTVPKPAAKPKPKKGKLPTPPNVVEHEFKVTGLALTKAQKARRAALADWAQNRLAAGWSWRRIKATKNWRQYVKLGGE